MTRTLRTSLDADEYKVFSDLILSDAIGITQIDHVVLSRHGVFVIETKNMSGWIFGSETQARWTQVLYSYRSRFQNPLRQNYRHVKALQKALGIYARQVFSIVVFTGSATPKSPMPRNVLWSDHLLPEFILEHREHRLSETKVAQLTEQLSGDAFKASAASRRAHLRQLGAKKGS